MAEQAAVNNPDKAVEELMKEIRREEVPKRILELARALQAALDKREATQK